MAESLNALFKTELHRNPAALADEGGPRRGLDDLEIATCRCVSWFNENRLTANSETPPRQRSRQPTTVDSLRPTRPEETNPTSTRQTQADS